MITAVRVVISGLVQGVGFRAWTVTTARRLGLKGWVRNRLDGTVEAVFSGEEAIVTSMIEACKSGPVAARADKIESYHWSEAVDAPFVAKPTM